MKARILIFGGTVEGRQVSDYLSQKHSEHTVCVATEYGEEVLAPRPERTVHQGRMDAAQMEAFLRGGSYALVVDATHPFAAEVSENIRAACGKVQLPYVRYLRAAGESGRDGEAPSAVFVDSAAEAAQFLESRQGGIFLTTGSKDLHVFTETISDKSRLWVRVLPSAEGIASCRELGLQGKQIFAMQGPFSAEINTAMLHQTKAAFLVTKETGPSGGFPEKMEAVRSCGITAVILRRPKENGLGWAELRSRLDEVLKNGDREPSAKQEPALSCQISCVGIGMGTVDTLTFEAAEAIRKAQVLFGAKRMLQSVQPLFEEADSAPQSVPEYEADRIRAYLVLHPELQRAVILMSGDVGFYSGAKQVSEVFASEQLRYYCGVSSVVYFASKIPTSWQDAALLSAHGKELPILNYVRKYRKIFLLVGGQKDVSDLCRELKDNGPDGVRVTVGSNLSYPEEKICSGGPADFCPCSTEGLHIMMIENEDAGEILTPGIPDDQFVRGRVPMTKEEVRILSVAKLRLREDSIVYDVGAGTGSVAAECARLCTAGKVYAIERNPEGIELIRENAAKIGVSNLFPVEGEAPGVLGALEAPTHAFIGGSSGAMRGIIQALRRKNPDVRIVINTISMESIAEVMRLIRELRIEDAEIVQVSAAKSRELGAYHMMTALNPVYIVSFGGDRKKI